MIGHRILNIHGTGGTAPVRRGRRSLSKNGRKLKGGSHALLAHMAITDDRRAQGRQIFARRRSAAELQNQLHRTAWDDRTEHLRHSSSGTEVISELQRFLAAG